MLMQSNARFAGCERGVEVYQKWRLVGYSSSSTQPAPGATAALQCSPQCSAAVPQAAAGLGGRHWRPVPLHTPRRAVIQRWPADSAADMELKSSRQALPPALMATGARVAAVEWDGLLLCLSQLRTAEMVVKWLGLQPVRWQRSYGAGCWYCLSARFGCCGHPPTTAVPQRP